MTRIVVFVLTKSLILLHNDSHNYVTSQLIMTVPISIYISIHNNKFCLKYFLLLNLIYFSGGYTLLMKKGQVIIYFTLCTFGKHSGRDL